MKQKIKHTFILLLIFATSLFAEIPAGYYDNANGLSGENLRSALYDIIKDHNPQTYDALWTHFQNTDKKSNGKVWDMYSDVPGGTPAYEYTFVTNQCGNYSGEGSCYNREHSFPKSWFNDASPMYTDLFHLYPTDGYVNGMRENYPYGETTSATWTSTNGSKVGSCSYSGYTETIFEPIDEYKGDFARTYFYMATRYYNIFSGWISPMLSGNNYTTWAINMLLEWDENDPVSQKEIDRNNAAYDIQNNRNPFIDHPEYVGYIWAGDSPTVDPEPTNHINNFSVAANGDTKINLTWAENDGTQAPAGYFIKASTSDNITNPTDSTAVSDNSTIGSNSGAKNISHGTTSYEWTELNAETQYYFKIYPHTNSGTDIDYKTTATVPNGNATTEKTPPASAVYISEVSDAPSDYHNEFMEIYNDNSSIYNLSNSKIIRYNSSGGFDDYVFDFATEGSGNTEIPANGFIVIARGSSKSNFETEWGNLPAGANYNEGTDELYLGTGRQWAVKDGGTADTDDGTEIDATNQVVADDDRDYQQPIGTWVNATDVTATPGEFDNDQSLPVTLLNFNANFKNGEIVLNWTTASESDNLGYKIYRKSDDEDAKLLSSYVDNDDLKGQGNSSERTNYKYTDLNVKTGVNYTYILKDVDFSGKETKSGEVNITTAENNLTVTDKYTLGRTYPNPFNPTFTIPLKLNENAFVNIQLINILGQKVLQIENSQMTVGNNDLQVNCENLNSGVYFVKVTVDNACLSSADRVNNIQKVVLLK